MEKRIKILYIITIIAIIAFLCLQGYWLYGRYEFSLMEYERSLSGRVMKCVDEYAECRDKSPVDYRRSKTSKSKNDSIIPIPSFEINNNVILGDSVRVSRKSTIHTYLTGRYSVSGVLSCLRLRK